MEKIQLGKLTPREKAEAFRTVFGHDPDKRTREQQIVWEEMVGQFNYFPTFVYTPHGFDTHLASARSGKVEMAKTVYDLTMQPLTTFSQEVQVTKTKDKDDQVDE